MRTAFFAALAAQAVNPVPGADGWVGAGLLGGVLAWLMFVYLPAKDKQITAMFERLAVVVAEKDKQIDAQHKEFTAALGALTASFRDEAKAERLACEKHYETLANSMSAAFKTVGDQLSQHSLRNQQWLDIMKAELERLTKLKGAT